MPYEQIVLLGAAASIISYPPYIMGTLRGNTKPNRVTWLMWAVAPLIAAFAEFSDGVTWPALPVFMAGFLPLFVFIASFVNPKAYWKLGRFDYVCGLCSVLALALWGVTKEPIVAIVFAMASDGFAAVPTLLKMWKYPETETVYPYMAGVFNQSTGLVAIGVWTFSAYAFPIYLILLNALLIFAFYRNGFSRA